MTADRQPHFIYLHGFNSKGKPNSDKVQELRNLGPVQTVDYDSFALFESIREHLIAELSARFEQNPQANWVLIGTSLGGYWSATMANHFELPAILINPAIQPGRTLKRHVGLRIENFVTGEPNTLTQETVSSYPDIPTGGEYLILLDSADEALDPTATQKYYQHKPVLTFEGGSHRFAHMAEALPYIRRFLKGQELPSDVIASIDH
jgi:predicted esterase YcpF (UPF0227 family)